MRVNYGRQEGYRLHHTEPACSSCEHSIGEDGKLLWCTEHDRWERPDSICIKYDREPGAD